MIGHLQLVSPKARRFKIQVTMVYKIVHERVDIDASHYLNLVTSKTMSKHSFKYRSSSDSKDCFRTYLDKMQIFIQAGELHVVEVTHQTVGDVKNFINEREGTSVTEQVLYHGGQPLQDDVQLAALGDMSTINVDVRMLGGKVHGSLARAGKVKGQTPKVDKQEKKKQKTGRAKRRMQYNRRFVNVVATFGRRKGPNANS
ncbi:hypothetical protein ScPMuIL_013950 [Solemya velum]